MKAAPLALALLAAASAAQAAEAAPRSAGRILAEMKRACGGSAWDRVRAWHETGVVDLPGRPGMPYEIWHDMATLRTAMLNRVEGRVVRQAGYDGASYWQAGPDGVAQIGSDPAMLRRQRRDAYLSSTAWFFRKRFPAAIVFAGTERVDGKMLDVLRIAPENAESFDLWVERDTHHVRRIVSGKEYADLTGYRMFGGVCSATLGRQGDGDPAHDILLHVRTVETDSPVPTGTFSPPVPVKS
jgi:hypothetical protein